MWNVILEWLAIGVIFAVAAVGVAHFVSGGSLLACFYTSKQRLRHQLTRLGDIMAAAELPLSIDLTNLLELYTQAEQKYESDDFDESKTLADEACDLLFELLGGSGPKHQAELELLKSGRFIR